MEKLVERLLIYVKVNTRSDANNQITPTTVGQAVLARMTETELHELGLADVHYNEQNGLLMARLPGNQPVTKSIGLIAHPDTANFSAGDTRLQVTTNYDGQDVLLNQEQGIVSSVAEFPNLKEYQGETLITTDGTTLLGVDSKVGIVEILAAVEYFLAHPEVARGDVWFVFGLDEEIGCEVDQFDAPSSPVAPAYTIDNGRVGHSEYEAFNVVQAMVTTEGTSVHPGTAYGSLINATKLGEQLD